MDFSRVELSDDDQAFQDDLRAFLKTIVTDEVIARDRLTGENFDEGVHLALGEAGYLATDFKDESEGGFTRLRRRIWGLEIGRIHTPWFHWGTTAMVARAVEQFGSDELKDEVMPKVLAGEYRLCLGYTEPEGGSDVATCKTRAVRDGDGWIINGSKMFTSNAQNAHYVYLITNTDPDAPKHQSLTMFLVPLNSAGVEIQPLRTVDGDRTNITYYSDVRIDDKYRVGEVNGGWGVLREALQRRARHDRSRHRRSGQDRRDVRTSAVARRGDRRGGGDSGRRGFGEIPPGPQHRADGSRDEHAGDVRSGGDRADHA